MPFTETNLTKMSKDFNDIPYEIKIKILGFMPIRSLSKLRYVNEEWRTMIYGMRKSIGKIVDAKIHSNEVKQVSAKTYNLNSYGLKVEAITPDYVLVKTKEASLTDSKAYVYQVKQNQRYELDYLSTDLVKESTEEIIEGKVAKNIIDDKFAAEIINNELAEDIIHIEIKNSVKRLQTLTTLTVTPGLTISRIQARRKTPRLDTKRSR